MDSSAKILSQVRSLVVDMAVGATSEPGRCRHWTELHLNVVRSHSLGPWLYRSLRDYPGVDLPAGILRDLHREYLDSCSASISREALIKELLAAFSRRDIPVVPVKGAYLGPIVYDNPALRPMCDIDILVGEHLLAQACDLLVAQGYELVVEPLDTLTKELQPALTYVHRNRSQESVDLHKALVFMDYYRFPSSLVWNEAYESRLYGEKVFFLTPELNFIHLALHNLNHGAMLRGWLDLVVLLNRTSFDWARFVSVARSLGVMRPMRWVAQELRRTWKIEPPAHVEQDLADYKPHWLEDPVIRSRFRYLWRFISRLRFVPGIGPKLSYVRLGLFPPPEFRIAVIGSVDWFAYLRSKFRYFAHFWRER